MEAKRKKSLWSRWLLSLFVAVFVIYPLSEGPVVWLVPRSNLAREQRLMVYAMYRPLFEVKNRCQYFAWLHYHYMRLFFPPPGIG